MKTNVFNAVTDRIIKQLEQGTAPWKRPWSEAGGIGDHRNLFSGHQYRGINAVLTSCQGYTSPLWLTFKQAEGIGGRIKRGEKATPIVYWMFGYKEDQGDNDEPSLKRWAAPKYSNVFNLEQTEGIDVEKLNRLAKSKQERIKFEPLEACESVLASYKTAPPIEHKVQRAFYRPSSDVVNMPKPESFDSVEAYYSTLFHELVHSTGHSKRLAREGVTNPTRFGDHLYSKEELVAELGAAFLCHAVGLSPSTEDQSAAYLASWIKVLKGDPRLIVQASSAAQKAFDLIMGREAQQFEQQKEGA